MVIFCIGICMGSFINCMAYRVSYDKKLSGRSVCDHCGRELEAIDLIPLLSFIFNKGKCRYCKSRISIINPLSELLAGFLYVSVIFKGYSIKNTIFCLLIITVLLFISLMDIYAGIIPDSSLLLLVLIDIIFKINHRKIIFIKTIEAFLIFLFFMIITIVYKKIKGIEGMGGGDIKLFTVLTFIFGINRILYIILLSSLLGILYCLINDKYNKRFSFGPFISISVIIILLIS